MDIEQSASFRRNDDPSKVVDLPDHECVQDVTSVVNLSAWHRLVNGSGIYWNSFPDADGVLTAVASLP